MKKNQPEFYGVDYLKSPLAGGPGLTRWEDNGVYYGTAVLVDALLRDIRGVAPQDRRSWNVLDVGCGRGFVVRHLRNLGYAAAGCEYGTEAVAHSVCGAEHGDLTKRLPYEDATLDCVTCVGVLSHLPPLNAQHALGELARVSRRLLVTNIQTVPHELSQHHLNMVGPEWWRPRFAKAGWREVDVSGILAGIGFRRSNLTWFAVWEKAGA